MHPNTVKLFAFSGVSVVLSAFFFITAPASPKWLDAVMGVHHGEHHDEAHGDDHAADDEHAGEEDHPAEGEEAVAKTDSDAKNSEDDAAAKAAAEEAKKAAEKHEKHIGVMVAMWIFLGIACALSALLSMLMGIWTAVRLDKMRGEQHAAAH